MATKAPDVSGKGTSGSVPEPGIGAELIEAWLAHSRDLDPDQQDWMSTIMPHMSVESHSADGPHPSVTFRFTVQPQHCNGMNNLHGGCTATLFDFATTMPILFLSKPGFWEYLGVSRTLNTTYLRPIPCGTGVFIHADVLQIGKRMATTRGTMRAINPDGTEGAVLAVCEHGKACIDPPKM